MKPRYFAIPLLSCLLISQAPAAERDYERVNFQGRLADAAGTAVAEGAYEMVFRLYDAPGTLLLTDRHIGTNAVAVSGGLYNALLGGGEIVPGRETNL